MKKQLFLVVFSMLFHFSIVYCEQTPDFSVADSLCAGKHYLRAIKQYSLYLKGDNADYALYKSGLCKKEIAEFCVNEWQFNKYPKMYKKRYGDKYPKYLEYLEYITGNKDFWYFESGAIHVYRGTDFQKIINEYPESDYVDNGAYELLLITRHRDWEGDCSIMESSIERCMGFITTYPESELLDEVIYLCDKDYSDLLYISDIPESEKPAYEKKAKKFHQCWIEKNENKE